jgi:folate-binding protein YgfZ
MDLTDITSLLLDTPLAEVHRAAGARMGGWFGCALPDDFGDVREEQRFLNESVGLIDETYRAYLSFTGPDRVRYLNAILTNNVKELAIGSGNTSLLLNPQGRILAELQVFALPDRLFCVSFAMIRGRLAEWLEKYIIMDDVTLTDESEAWGTLALEGPKTGELVQELTAADFGALGDMTCVDVAVRHAERGRSAIAGRLVRVSAVRAEFVAARKDLLALWKIFGDAAGRAGGGPVGYSALSAQRLVQGVPWFGYDFGEKQIPHEAGLQDSHISYTKGCYTGQEIVERVRSRGQVNRRRVGLRFGVGAEVVGAEAAGAAVAVGSGEVPAAGAVVMHGGVEAGYITRAARSYFPAAVLAMAYLRKEAAAVGTVVSCGSQSATVVELPLGGAS